MIVLKAEEGCCTIEDRMIYITGSKVWAEGGQIEWGGGDLGFVLRQIKNKLQTAQIRVVLGFDVSRVLVVSLPVGEVTKEKVTGVVEEVLGEDLTVYNLEWKLLRTDKKANLQLVEVILVRSGLLENLRFVAEENQVELTAVDPVAKVIGTKVKTTEPELLVWKEPTGEKIIGVVASEGVAYWVEDVTNEREEKIRQLRMIAEQRYDLRIKDEQVKTLENLETVEVKEETREEFVQKKEQTPPGLKRYVIMAVVIVAIGVAMLGIWMKTMNKPVQTPVQSPQVTEAVSSPTPSPEVTIKPESYTVRILNGTGVAGGAKKVADLLTAGGFTKVELGNAETYDHTVTEISVKEEVSAQVGEQIQSLLSSDYQVEIVSAPLDEKVNYDVLVVTGTAK